MQLLDNSSRNYLDGGGEHHETKLGKEGWWRKKMRKGLLLFSGDYSGLQRVLKNFIYIVLTSGSQWTTNM